MEDIHSEMYSLMIDTLIMDKEHKNRLFNAINTIPCIQKRVIVLRKWSNPSDNDLPRRLVAWGCVEGIHFSGSFCAIFWLKKRNYFQDSLLVTNSLVVMRVSILILQ